MVSMHGMCKTIIHIFLSLQSLPAKVDIFNCCSVSVETKRIHVFLLMTDPSPEYKSMLTIFIFNLVMCNSSSCVMTLSASGSCTWQKLSVKISQVGYRLISGGPSLQVP